MSTDRELLEAAAKAAGVALRDWRDDWAYNDSDKGGASYRTPAGELWNPLRFDDDALRLAVKLRLCLFLEIPRIGIGPMLDGPEVYVEDGEDEMEATRRAIVRAAAEIGGRA
jgi:hypothetical protein